MLSISVLLKNIKGIFHEKEKLNQKTSNQFPPQMLQHHINYINVHLVTFYSAKINLFNQPQINNPMEVLCWFGFCFLIVPSLS